MRDEGYIDERVSAGRMTRFITGVSNRLANKRGRKPKPQARDPDAMEEEPAELPPRKTVGVSVVKQYASAIMDLWKSQHEVRAIKCSNIDSNID
jgi:hypothetical protein